MPVPQKPTRPPVPPVSGPHLEHTRKVEQTLDLLYGVAVGHEQRIEEAALAGGLTWGDPRVWDAAATYPPLRQVEGSDGAWYVSTSTTTGDDPTAGGPWEPVPTALDASLRAGVDPAAGQVGQVLAYRNGKFRPQQKPVVDVRDYGAVGDGNVDDTAALAAAFAAAAARTVGFLPGAAYKVSAGLDVPAGCRVAGNGATVVQTGTGVPTLNIVGDDVTVEGLRLVGRQKATVTVGEDLIRAVGTVATPLRNLTVVGCELSDAGRYGIYFQHVRGFAILDSHVHDIHYAGVMGLSVVDGRIVGNLVENIEGDGLPNNYGIAVTRETVGTTYAGGLALAPRSRDVLIEQNIVRNVPRWEGLDTHGGERITFRGNAVTGCLHGIAAVGAPLDGGTVAYAPLQVVIEGNVVDSLVDDGSYRTGIVVGGAQGTLGAPNERATGAIIGNTVSRHGRADNELDGAVRARDTVGLVISGNVVDRPSPAGIVLSTDNREAVVTGNTVSDVWSDTYNIPTFVVLRSGHNTALIANNVGLDNGGKPSAVFRNVRGINYNSGLTGNEVSAGQNRMVGAATAVVNQANVRHTFDSQVVAQAAVRGPNGTAAAPALTFDSDPDTGFYRVTDDSLGISAGGALRFRVTTTGYIIPEGMNFSLGTGTGTRFGVGATQKIGFYGATPVVRPSLPDAGSVTAADIRAVLISLGLCS
jgi:hypothetical protein